VLAELVFAHPQPWRGQNGGPWPDGSNSGDVFASAFSVNACFCDHHSVRSPINNQRSRRRRTSAYLLRHASALLFRFLRTPSLFGTTTVVWVIVSPSSLISSMTIPAATPSVTASLRIKRERLRSIFFSSFQKTISLLLSPSLNFVRFHEQVLRAPALVDYKMHLDEEQTLQGRRSHLAGGQGQASVSSYNKSTFVRRRYQHLTLISALLNGL
jgi:hypothetical protein